MDNLNADRKVTCCFAGYRPHRFPYKFNTESPEYNTLVAQIKQAIETSYSDGFRNFLCGGMIGFDILCAEQVLEIKKVHPDIRLIFLLPYPHHDKHFPIPWRLRFRKTMEQSDAVYHVDTEYTGVCYQIRNLDMVLNSTRLIVYFSGCGGGTAGIVARAQQLRLDIVNLYIPPKRTQEFTFFAGGYIE